MTNATQNSTGNSTEKTTGLPPKSVKLVQPSNMEIIIRNQQPLDLCELPKYLKEQSPTNSTQVPEKYDNYAWQTSPIIFNNPHTVAAIMSEVAELGYGAFGSFQRITATHVTTTEGKSALIFSGAYNPKRRESEYAKLPDGSNDYTTTVESEHFIWDDLAFMLAKYEKKQQEFCDQFLITTVVTMSKNTTGQTRSLVVVSHISQVWAETPIGIISSEVHYSTDYSVSAVSEYDFDRYLTQVEHELIEGMGWVKLPKSSITQLVFESFRRYCLQTKSTATEFILADKTLEIGLKNIHENK